MDKLRLTLLIIGCLVVLGIYLWEVFFKSVPRKKTDILDAVDDMPDMPLTSSNDEADDFSAAMSDLGSLLTQSRNEGMQAYKQAESFTTSQAPNTPDESHEDLPLPLEQSVKDYEAELSQKNDYDVFAAIEEDIHEQETTASTEVDQQIEVSGLDKDSDEILVLFITSPTHTLFNGLSISKAADEVGMVYGHMNIFHHFGPGKLHSGQPLFSIANMYEPGSFDLGRMAELKTKGIAAFMYSPASIDASVVFELYLNTTQRIARLLGGDVRTSDNEILNSASIKSLRDKAASLSDNN